MGPKLTIKVRRGLNHILSVARIEVEAGGCGEFAAGAAPSREEWSDIHAAIAWIEANAAPANARRGGSMSPLEGSSECLTIYASTIRVRGGTD